MSLSLLSLLQRLRHPFVVRLHWAFLSAGASQVFLVMEALLGGELYAMMQDMGFLPSSSAASWARRKAATSARWGAVPGYGLAKGMPEAWARFYAAEIGAALFHLHRHGVLYRDLKPENVMLRLDGHVALTDFGLAMDREEEEGQGEIAGTLPYLSPDMLGDDPPTEAVDWWSLGFLLFEMLYGAPPFGTRVLTGSECGKDALRREQLNRIMFAPLSFPSNGKQRPRALAVSAEARDCVRRLLIRNEHLRLGSGAGGHVPRPRRRSLLQRGVLALQGVSAATLDAIDNGGAGAGGGGGGGGGGGDRGTMVAGRGFHEVEDHPFFAGIDFRLLVTKQLAPPWLPTAAAAPPVAAPKMADATAERYLGPGGEAELRIDSAGQEDLHRLRADFKAYTAAPVTEVIVEQLGISGGRRASTQAVYTGSADTKRLRLTQVF